MGTACLGTSQDGRVDLGEMRPLLRSPAGCCSRPVLTPKAVSSVPRPDPRTLRCCTRATRGYGDGSRAVTPWLHLSHTPQGGGGCCPLPGSGSDPGMGALCPLLGTSGIGKLSHSPAGAEGSLPCVCSCTEAAGRLGRESFSHIPFSPHRARARLDLHPRDLIPKLSKNLHLNVQPPLQQGITHGGASESGVGRCL